MFETIVGYCAAAMLLLLGVVFWVLLMAWILPRLLLRPRYRTDDIKDRGVQKYTFANGRAITYQPAMQMRRYVNSYVLSCNGGEKYIKCQLDPRIASIRYDLIVFDACDRVISVLHVCDPIRRSGYTEATNLPLETAYVRLIVREVDGCPVCEDTVGVRSAVRMWLYALLCAVISAVGGGVLHAVSLYVTKEWIGYEELARNAGALFPILAAFITGACCAGIIILIHRSRDIGTDR